MPRLGLRAVFLLLASACANGQRGLHCEADSECVGSGWVCENGECKQGAHGPPARLDVTSDLQSIMAGGTVTITVQALDARGQRKTSATMPVTVECPGGTAPGTVQVVSGLAQFPIVLTRAGTQSTTIRAAGTPDASVEVTVTPATPQKLAIAVPAAGSTVITNRAFDLRVEVHDTFENVSPWSGVASLDVMPTDALAALPSVSFGAEQRGIATVIATLSAMGSVQLRAAAWGLEPATVPLLVSPPTYLIAGRISGTDGVDVSLTGTASASTTADATGRYSFPGLVDGAYVVTPSKPGFVFTPDHRAVTVAGADVAGQDFVAAIEKHVIAGTIAGGAAVTVSLATQAGQHVATAVTDGSGTFSFPAVENGAYTVTPIASGYAFEPLSRGVTVAGAAVWNVNFTATRLVPLTDTFPVGRLPLGVAYRAADDTVWIANRNDNTVSRLSGSTGALVAIYATGAEPHSIAIDPTTDSVWITNNAGGTVTRLNAIDGSLLGTHAVGVNPRGVAFDNDHSAVWIANSNPDGQGTVSKLSALDGSLIGTYYTGDGYQIALWYAPLSVAYDTAHNSVWVSNSGGVISQLDATTGVVVDEFPARWHPSYIALDGRRLWITAYSGNALMLFDVNTETFGPNTATGPGPVGVAIDWVRNHVWIANHDASTVTRVNGADGSVLGTYVVGSRPYGIAFDGARLWVTNSGDNTVTRLTP